MIRVLLLSRCDTVDGRNPTLPGMYENLVNNGISTTNLNWCVDPGFLVGINNVFLHVALETLVRLKGWWFS